MKRKSSVAAILLFLGVNTSFLWENLDGLGDLAVFLMLGIVYIVLVFVLILKVGALALDKFHNKPLLVNVAIISCSLALCYAFPFGIIRPDYYDEPEVMRVAREGGGNCGMTISLKEDSSFVYTRVCFGVDRLKGNYTIHGDTVRLLFEKDHGPIGSNPFGIMELENNLQSPIKGYFHLYRDFSDTVPYPMYIQALNESFIKSVNSNQNF